MEKLNLGWPGIVVGVVFAVVLVVLAIRNTPLHRPGCNNPYCKGCGGGPN